MMITGTEYFCRLARISIRTLAERAGICGVVANEMYVGKRAMKRSLVHYMRVAEALHVTVDDLLRQYDDAELDEGDRTAYPSRTEDLRNCVAVYRRKKGLTYAQLGERLGGKTRECARQACADAQPRRKHIRVLAAYEGITPEEFCRLYAPEVV